MALDAYLKFEGGDPTVEGSSAREGHEKEIEVMSYSFGITNPGSRHTATGGGTGIPEMGDLFVTFATDQSAVNLWISVAIGNHFDKVTLFVRKSGGTDPVTFKEVQMTDAVITSYQTGGSNGADTPIDSISINYAQIEYIYRPQQDDGTAGADMTQTYNIAQGKKV